MLHADLKCSSIRTSFTGSVLKSLEIMIIFAPLTSKFILMKATFISLCIISFTISSFSQDKKTLSHDDYDNWGSLRHQLISNNGNWVSWEVNPQKGDGELVLFNDELKNFKRFERGKAARFSPNSNFIVFKITPGYDTIRQAELKKHKKDKLPKDSLGIYLFDKDSLIKAERVQSFKLPEDNGNWFAYLHEKPLKEKTDKKESDTTETEKEDTEKPKKDKENQKLVLLNPISGSSFTYDYAKDYAFSKNGEVIAFSVAKGDSVDSTFVYRFNTKKTKPGLIYARAGESDKLAVSDDGKFISFLHTADTGEVKVFNLLLFERDDLIQTIDTNNVAMPDGWAASTNAEIRFSEDGERMYYGTAPIPEPEPEDTLTKDEKVSVDIWNWKDPLLQTHQLKQLEREKKRTYQAVYHIDRDNAVQLETEDLRNISIDLKQEGEYAMGVDYLPYRKLLSWEASRYRDIYLVNQETGEKKLIGKRLQSSNGLSPGQKYVYWYDASDSNWKAYVIATEETVNLTGHLDINWYNEEHDMPDEPYPYGKAGWTKDDKAIVIYDKYDLWKIDPDHPEEAVNLTAGYGRENDISFRYVKLNKESQFLDDDIPLILHAFNEENKNSGYYRFDLKPGEPEKLIIQAYRFSGIKKAEDAKKLIWRKESFQTYPDLWISDLSFSNPEKISNINPQQDEYLWGTVELINWVSLDGRELEGLLYKPENFDPGKKYPMLVYFYETYSNSLHEHYTPRPSRSVINFTYYVSNGYMIFIPNIRYGTGSPGQDAYDAVLSGTMHLLENPWVDKENMGLQGQSWGGYQVAYIVTQTDLYKAAMAGAPVSNMTSAYGGIRWGSGMSRMFQYEESQSRIGGTLWEKPMQYIENSPLFYAPQIKTPLLIMHNDNDGAVPWYQGIELFVALRRLNKPVWMLTYNKAPHNLKRRADMEDLTKRMQQFFDHYLKDAPAPKWMVEGVPAIEKGKEFGFELIEE